MQFRPLEDKILIKRTNNIDTSVGGIIIPDTAQEKSMQGEILAVGPGRWEDGNRSEMYVSVGDMVIFGKWSGTEVELDGNECMIITQDDIIGVLK